jgi:hypothetical protein
MIGIPGQIMNLESFLTKMKKRNMGDMLIFDFFNNYFILYLEWHLALIFVYEGPNTRLKWIIITKLN